MSLKPVLLTMGGLLVLTACGDEPALIVRPSALRTFGPAERHLQAGLEFCSERGLDIWRMYLLAHGSSLDLDRGRWDDAVS